MNKIRYAFDVEYREQNNNEYYHTSNKYDNEEYHKYMDSSKYFLVDGYCLERDSEAILPEQQHPR
jgi:hypothetical protein